MELARGLLVLDGSDRYSGLADYVLPAASFLEFDDLVMSYFNHSVSAQVAALKPPREALPIRRCSSHGLH